MVIINAELFFFAKQNKIVTRVTLNYFCDKVAKIELMSLH
jgi:hypothetical protein